MDSRSGQSRLRLTPEGLVGGPAALALCEAGGALALAGGPLAFTHARLTGVDAPDHEPFSVSDLRRWIAREAGMGDDGPATLVEAVSEPRRDFAGLTLAGAGVRPRLMGICNVTPDSFSDGGDHADPSAAIGFAMTLAEAGAEIIDVGGESTRPGAAPVSVEAEIDRVVPVVAALAANGLTVSIDTRRAPVMRAAVAAGAAIINDVSALSDDPDSLRVAVELGVPVILMHMQGTPATMQDDPQYADVVSEVYDALAARMSACLDAGIPRGRIAIDPGFGFGKTVDHNVALLAGLARFHGLGCAVAIGVSRKSFIGALTGVEDPKHRLTGSIAAALAAANRGAQILRVHDVAETRCALDIWQAAIDLAE